MPGFSILSDNFYIFHRLNSSILLDFSLLPVSKFWMRDNLRVSVPITLANG